ncbi:recombinase family protein [Verrucomicrobiota bacterium]
MKKSKLARFEFHQTPSKGKKCAIYVRVSVNEFRSRPAKEKERLYRMSVITQEKDGIAFAKDKGWKRYEVYKNDCSQSGLADPSEEERQDLSRIITEIKKGKIHTIVVRDQKRLSRSTQFTANFLHDILLTYGVNCLAWDQRIDIETPEGQRMFIDHAAHSQNEVLYSTRHSKRNRDALAEEGGLASRPCYGYTTTKHKNVVRQVSEEVTVVRNIFAWYLAGKSLMWISRELNRRKIPTKTSSRRQRKIWNIASIRGILRQKKYVGRIEYNGKEYASPYEAVFSDAYFNKVQREIEKRSTVGHRARGSNHLLTGILKCGYCSDRLAQTGQDEEKFGYHLYANLTHNQACKYSDRKFFYYICQSKKRYGVEACQDSIRLNAGMMEAFVREYVSLIAVEKFRKYVSQGEATKQELENRIEEINKEVTRLRHRKQSISKTFAADRDLTEDDYVRTLKELTNQINRQSSDLEEALAQLAQVGKSPAVESLITLQDWENLTLQEQRQALQKVMPQIKVYRDGLFIYMAANEEYPIRLNFKQGDHGKRYIEPEICEEFTKFMIEFRGKVPFADLLPSEIPSSIARRVVRQHGAKTKKKPKRKPRTTKKSKKRPG